MDVLEEVQPYGRTSGSATLMDVLEEVQPYGRT